MAHWHAVRSEQEQVIGLWFGIIMAGFLVGAATGGVLFGWLGDRIGRVRAMTLSVLTYALFTGLCGVVGEAWQVGMLRFIASLGMGGEWSLGVALVMEVWPNKSRAFMAGLIGAAANVGYLLVGFVGPGPLGADRNLQAAGCSALGLPDAWVEMLVAQQRLAADDAAGHAAGAAHVLHPHLRARIGEVAKGEGEGLNGRTGRRRTCWAC